MYTAVKGIYENGKLTLLEPAPTLNRQEVLVTFLNETFSTTTKQRRSPGGLLRLDQEKAFLSQMILMNRWMI